MGRYQSSPGDLSVHFESSYGPSYHHNWAPHSPGHTDPPPRDTKPCTDISLQTNEVQRASDLCKVSSLLFQDHQTGTDAGGFGIRPETSWCFSQMGGYARGNLRATRWDARGKNEFGKQWNPPASNGFMGYYSRVVWQHSCLTDWKLNTGSICWRQGGKSCCPSL